MPDINHKRLTEDELKLIEKTQALVMNTKGERYGHALSPLEILTYRERIRKTPNFLEGITKAQMKRMAHGEERVPGELSKLYADDLFRGLKPSWTWMKGVIAVAVADGYEPPLAEGQKKRGRKSGS